MTKLKWAVNALCWIVMVVTIVYLAYLPFTRPELTRTQLVIEFRTEYGLGAVLLICIGAIQKWTEKTKDKSLNRWL